MPRILRPSGRKGPSWIFTITYRRVILAYWISRVLPINGKWSKDGFSSGTVKRECVRFETHTECFIPDRPYGFVTH